MRHLIYKELRLVLHPTALVFLPLSALLLVPNYPYLITFFYTGLSVFFTCLNGREAHDISYSLALPVSKHGIVTARFLLVTAQQFAQVLLAIPFALLRQKLTLPQNMVGMDANIALFGFAFAMYGIFNLCYFGIYYRNVQKVGSAFAWSSLAVGIFLLLEESCAHVIPFCRDRLDTTDPLFLSDKLLVLVVGLLVYLCLTFIAYRRACRDFVRQDL